ncbi:MAG: hypothetical protein ACYDG0_04075, partial [Vulcanimicrobiaceae bacterium]
MNQVVMRLCLLHIHNDRQPRRRHLAATALPVRPALCVARLVFGDDARGPSDVLPWNCAMRIVIVSDTHLRHDFALPDGDMLLH